VAEGQDRLILMNSDAKLMHAEDGGRDMLLRKMQKHCLSMQGWSSKVKATLGLNLAKDAKGNKKCSVKTVSPKSRIRKQKAHCMTKNMER